MSDTSRGRGWSPGQPRGRGGQRGRGRGGSPSPSPGAQSANNQGQAGRGQPQPNNTYPSGATVSAGNASGPSQSLNGSGNNSSAPPPAGPPRNAWANPNARPFGPPHLRTPTQSTSGSSSMTSAAAVPTAAMGNMSIQPQPARAFAPQPASSSLAAQHGNAFTPRAGLSQQTAATSQSSSSTVSDIAYVRTLAERIFRQQQGPKADSMSEREKAEGLKKIVQKFGFRKAYATTDPNIKVEVNYLDLTRKPDTIYVYSLEMIREFDATNNSPIFVKKQWDRVQVIHAIQQTGTPFAQALLNNSAKWVTDGDLIWSVERLFDHANPPAAQSHVQYTNEMGVVLDVESVSITFNQSISTTAHVGELFYDATAPRYHDSLPGVLTRGLNAFLTNRLRSLSGSNVPLPQRVTITSANRSFRNATSRALLANHNDNTVRTLQGYFLSVRPGSNSILVNISHATSAFFEPISVYDLMLSCGALGRSQAEVNGLLKGVRVRRMHPGTGSNTRYITNVGNHVVRQLCNDFPTITVAAWYNQQNGLALTNLSPNDPNFAINTGKDPVRFPGEQEWYAPQHLLIEEWCRFNGTLLRDETTAMIKVAQKKALQHRNSLLTSSGQHVSGVDHFGLNSGHLQNFNMRAGTVLKKIPGRWLQPPGISYRNTTAVIDENKAKWDLKDKKFLDQGQISNLFVLNISPWQPPQNFDNLLRGQLFDHGLSTARSIPITPTGPVRLNVRREDAAPSPVWERAFKNAVAGVPGLRANSGNILLVIMRSKSFEEYACIKRVLDTQLGIHSICITQQALGGKPGWNLQMASNLALKFSIKSSLDVYQLEDENLNVLRTHDQIANTIILGADVAHPSNGAFEGTPSVAAVVGTRDDRFIKFGGSMRLQRGRKEDITALDDMIRERVLAFAETHEGQLPENLLFYRDGVSESQYDIVRRRELPQIQNAMNEAMRYLEAQKGQVRSAPAKLKMPDPLPNDPQEEKEALEKWAAAVETQTGNVKFKLTFVVVGKRHNTRFYPSGSEQRIGGPNDNVKPGLVVDQEICHPFSTDFYLQSHEPIQGTGKSAHYFVLQNSMGLDVETLQSITHTLCYAYARTTRGVSYCAPAYYADRLCDRGRAYIRHFLTNSPRLLGYIHPLTNQAPVPPVQLDRYQPKPANQSHQDRMIYCANHIATNGNYFRGWSTIRPSNPQVQQYGQERLNPWHPNLDNTMFWL